MSFILTTIDTEENAIAFYQKIGMVKIEILHGLLSTVSNQLTPNLPVTVWKPITISNGGYFFKPVDCEQWSMSTVKSAASFGIDAETIGVCTTLIALRLLNETFPQNAVLENDIATLTSFAGQHREAYVINRICFEG